MEKPLLETVPSNKSILSKFSNPFIIIPFIKKSSNDAITTALTEDNDLFSTTSDVTWSVDDKISMLDGSYVVNSTLMVYAISFALFIIIAFCVYLIIMVLIRKT